MLSPGLKEFFADAVFACHFLLVGSSCSLSFVFVNLRNFSAAVVVVVELREGLYPVPTVSVVVPFVCVCVWCNRNFPRCLPVSVAKSRILPNGKTLSIE